MKRILVPCDFSGPAVEAFRFALDIAAKSGGEVMLLHTIELPVLHDTTLMPTLNFEEQALKDLRADVEKKITRLKSKWSKEDERVKHTITYGPVAAEIVRVAAERKSDLIIMGTKGATGLKDYFVGSNTEKVVRRSKVPVIAVKKFVKASSIRNIVFPNSLDKEQEGLTLKVKDLQDFFKAKVHILFVNTPAEFHRDSEAKKALNTFAKRFMFKNYTLNIFNDIDQVEGVIHFAREINADLIVMATHGRKGLNHLMTGSVAEDLVNSIHCPIWTSVEK